MANRETAFFTGYVEEGTIGVVERFGRFQSVVEPGRHFFNTFAGEYLAGVLTTGTRSLDVNILTITKDKVFVQVLCSVQYRVVKEHAYDAFYKLPNPDCLIHAYVANVVRVQVLSMTLDDLYERKNEVAKTVLEEVEKVMVNSGYYGYSIEHIMMVDIIRAIAVQEVINAAQQLQLASVYEGEAESKYLGGVGDKAVGEHLKLL